MGDTRCHLSEAGRLGSSIMSAWAAGFGGRAEATAVSKETHPEDSGEQGTVLGAVPSQCPPPLAPCLCYRGAPEEAGPSGSRPPCPARLEPGAL